MGFVKHVVWSLCLLGVLCTSNAGAQVPDNKKPEVKATVVEKKPIRVVPSDGCNLTIDEQIDDHRLVMKLDSPCHNWFSVQLADLPTDAPVIIGLSMEGMDTKNKADVKKWVGLMPVITYGDPANPDGMECFQLDEKGRWVSSDPFKTGDARYAGTGKTPVQTVIPAAAAAEFLSKDGKTWEPYKEVDKAEAVTELNIFRITQRFTLPNATISMRVPYTYTHELAYLEKLKAAKISGVTVDKVSYGHEAWINAKGVMERRYVQIIRFEAPANPGENLALRPTILVYAREHATEPDGSIAIEGMVNWLVSSDPAAVKARTTANWLFFPILDPDGTTHSVFRVADDFSPNAEMRDETYMTALYMVEKWIDTGHRVDLAINLHSLECTEGPNLDSPFITIGQKKSIVAFNTQAFARVKKAGFETGKPDGWATGGVSARFAYWFYRGFSTQGMSFEMNTRYPKNRLNITQQKKLGVTLIDGAVDYVQGKDFETVRTGITDRLAARPAERDKWFKARRVSIKYRTLYELYLKGY